MTQNYQWLVINENRQPLFDKGTKQIFLFITKKGAIEALKKRAHIDRQLNKIREIVKIELPIYKKL